MNYYMLGKPVEPKVSPFVVISASLDAKRRPNVSDGEHLWSRVTKVCEESGEVWRALSGWRGENPRKGETHTLPDLKGELLDTAAAALAGWAHLTGNDTDPLPALLAHVEVTAGRLQVGLIDPPDQKPTLNLTEVQMHRLMEAVSEAPGDDALDRPWVAQSDNLGRGEWEVVYMPTAGALAGNWISVASHISSRAHAEEMVRLHNMALAERTQPPADADETTLERRMREYRAERFRLDSTAPLKTRGTDDDERV